MLTNLTRWSMDRAPRWACVHGRGLLRDPGEPESPFYPRRTCLTIERPAVPYDALFNGLEWRAGCP